MIRYNVMEAKWVKMIVRRNENKNSEKRGINWLQ